MGFLTDLVQSIFKPMMAIALICAGIAVLSANESAGSYTQSAGVLPDLSCSGGLQPICQALGF